LTVSSEKCKFHPILLEITGTVFEFYAIGDESPVPSFPTVRYAIMSLSKEPRLQGGALKHKF
jgi:hypothetical protein